MFETRLFLGLPVNDLYQNELNAVPVPQRNLFIQMDKSSPYLQETVLAGVHYLGKELPLPTKVGDLDLVAAHILSLLHRLVPHIHFKENSLVLVAVAHHPIESTTS